MLSEKDKWMKSDKVTPEKLALKEKIKKDTEIFLSKSGNKITYCKMGETGEKSKQLKTRNQRGLND